MSKNRIGRGTYVNFPASSDSGGMFFAGGYFPPLIFDDLSKIVSSRTESFSSFLPMDGKTTVVGKRCGGGFSDCRRLRASAFVMSASHAERQRVRVVVGRVDVDARVRYVSIAVVYSFNA